MRRWRRRKWKWRIGHVYDAGLESWLRSLSQINIITRSVVEAVSLSCLSFWSFPFVCRFAGLDSGSCAGVLTNCDVPDVCESITYPNSLKELIILIYFWSRNVQKYSTKPSTFGGFYNGLLSTKYWAATMSMWLRYDVVMTAAHSYIWSLFDFWRPQRGSSHNINSICNVIQLVARVSELSSHPASIQCDAQYFTT